MIRLYNYDTSQCIASVNEIKSEITMTANEFYEAVVKISTTDYYNNRDSIIPLNVIELADPITTQKYRIINIDVQQTYCTITAQHILCTSRKCYCSKWDWEIGKEWSLYDLVLELSDGLTTQSSGKTAFGNRNVYSNHEYQIIILDEKNAITQRPTNPKWYYKYTNIDWLGKSLNEILNEIKDMTDIYIMCYDSFTFDFSFASFSQYTQYADISYYNNLPQFFTASNAQNFSYKMNALNFVAASRGRYNYEVNDRFEKITDKKLSGTKYNKWYQQLYGSVACMRYYSPHSVTSDITWDRSINMWVNVYDVQQGENNRQVSFEIDYLSDEADARLIEIPIYNIVKEQIATASGFTWNSTQGRWVTTIVDPETQATWGKCYLYPIAGETKKFTLSGSLLMEQWKGVNFKFAPTEIQWQKILNVAEKPEKELKLCDIFGKDFGSVNFENFTETDSGDPSQGTVKIWQIKGADIYDNIVVKGHVWLQYNELYATYSNKIESDVQKQTQVWLDSYSQKLLESINVTPMADTINTIIYPSDDIKVWSNELGVGVTLRVESVTYDTVSKRYTNINTGYRRKNLKEINVELTDLKKRVKNQ